MTTGDDWALRSRVLRRWACDAIIRLEKRRIEALR